MKREKYTLEEQNVVIEECLEDIKWFYSVTDDICWSFIVTDDFGLRERLKREILNIDPIQNGFKYSKKTVDVDGEKILLQILDTKLETSSKKKINYYLSLISFLMKNGIEKMIL